MPGPAVRYARSGEVSIAYQVLGRGPDLVYSHGWLSNLEMMWEDPAYAAFLRRLAAFSRLIVFDKRGTGLSDRVALSDLPSLETRVDDLRAVMDAAGSSCAYLFGMSEAGVLAACFAAEHPERVNGIVLYATMSVMLQDEDAPWAYSPEFFELLTTALETEWGQPFGVELWAPTLAEDERFREWFGRHLRLAASPEAALAMMRMIADIDIRPLLASIRVPTLVIQRTDDLMVDVRHSRYIADHVPGARYVELPGRDHLAFVGDADAVADAVEHFVTGVRPRRRAQPMSFGAAALSRREREVVRLTVAGMTAPAIAHRLGIGARTVETHLGSAYRKLDVTNRAELIRRVNDLGI